MHANLGHYRPATVIGILLFIAGVIGAIVHGALSNVETPVLNNQYPGMWFALFLVITSIQLLHLNYKPSTLLAQKRHLVWNCLYFGLVWLGTFISAISWGIAKDRHALGWACIGLFANAGAIMLLVLRYRNGPLEIKEVVPETEMEKNQPKLKSKSTSCGLRTLTCLNGTLKFLHIFFLALLCNGGIAQAGIKKYDAPGIVIPVQLTDGRTAKLHYLCDGPKAPDLPVIWISADAAHGVMDFLGLQHYLVNSGRRVCTYDNLGYGWSSDLLARAEDQALYLDNLITATKETLPMIFVAWGGGGSPVMDYAKRHPENVAGMSFIEVSPPGVEFGLEQVRNGWDDKKTLDYRTMSMKGRAFLGNVILGLGIPWGLMSVFVPLNPQDLGYYPPSDWRKFKVQAWASSMWEAQLWGIKYIQTHPDSTDPLFAASPVPSSIPLSVIMCAIPNTQICQPVNKPALTGSACEKAQFENEYYIGQKIRMGKIASSSAVFKNNTDADCALSMPVSKPEWTAQAVLDMVGNIRA